MHPAKQPEKVCQKNTYEAYKPNYGCFLPTQPLFRYSDRVKQQELVKNRVKMLRSALEEAGLHAYIVPSGDPHGSEYVSAHYQSRAWISGFSGSAGTVCVTDSDAGLWTDSRYYLEADRVLADTGIDLFRMQEPGVPGVPEFLARSLSRGSRVGIPRMVVSCAEFDRIHATLTESGISLEATDDLIAPLWNERPPVDAQTIVVYEDARAGETRLARIERVRERMKQLDATAYLISSLDDIAWLMNLRGSDVPFNPVFFAYVLVTPGTVSLYVHLDRLSVDARDALARDRIQVCEYADVFTDLAGLPGQATVLYDADKVSVALRERIPAGAKHRTATDVTTVFKARKNPVEQTGIRNAMVRDGVAMVRFLMWLETAVAQGNVTELAAAKRLREFRSMGEGFVGESFTTISGFGAHGAIVHYSAEESTQATLGDGVYLLDSGGQYLDGTTDITRTLGLGSVPPQARTDYTMVLRALIALSEIRFPAGTSGAQLDMVARQVLWAAGTNYGHGTGHGVGCYLNVHEGPQRLAPRGHAVALEEGMLSSNEPGLYREGRWGIRLENLILVTPGEQTDFGLFHRFETVTLCPFDLGMVDMSLLRPDEVDWLNRYHAEVFSRLSPHLEPAERAWLAEKTRA